MSGHDLVVDLVGLQKVGDDLEKVKSDMEHFSNIDEHSVSERAIADDKVRGALNDFQDGWRDGRKEIAGGIDSVSKMAKKTVETFEKKDKDLADELVKNGGHK